MTRRLILGLFVAVVAVVLVACSTDSPSQPTTPTVATTASSPTATLEVFLGQWGSDTSGEPTAEPGVGISVPATLVSNGRCSLLDFKVDRDADSRSAVIVFIATCANARIRGEGRGQVSGDTLYWRAGGTVTLAGGRTCPFTFADGNSATPAGSGLVKVTYNGTVCSMPVSGTQIVKRR
jgi:hypothetical protein